MKTDKQVKAEFKKTASKDFKKYYATSPLKENGYYRNKCTKTGTWFWSQDENRKVCGDPEAIGGFQFIDNPNSKKKFDYLETWTEFKKYFKKKGYLEYDRYPVVSRWREDVYWTGASVYPFQPYVVSGEIKPKSNSVIIPQLSMRFNDIDNVGITGSHYVCFDMLGQLHFEQKKDYDQDLYWQEYFDWITKGMGVPESELIMHEDAWAGGGTFGPCMEFFSKGMEIGNHVYMMFKQEEKGYSELDIKVLDMGQGHERVPWFLSGKSNSYESTFPSVAKHLYKITGHKPDEQLMQAFLPYSALLNVDEVDDIQKVWKQISTKIKIDEKELKENVLSLAAIYSIGEHSRASLIALNDKALPSNVGGGYNLRTIMRRMFGFVEQYKWDVDIPKLFELHAKFLKPMYPELSKNVKETLPILENEYSKFLENRKRSKQTIERILQKKITTQQLIELYDSQGIAPEQVKAEAQKKDISVNVPDNFYMLISERHEQGAQKVATKKKERIDVSKIAATKKLFWKDWKTTKFSAKVVFVKDNLIALDQTAFYPTSGGQLHDVGELEGNKVVDVFKAENEVIIHKLKEKAPFKKGQKISGMIDGERRKQLMQHHTSAHLVNAVAQEVLGRHVWQAGAAKTLEKGRLDITHFELPSEKQLKEMEKRANQYIKKGIAVQFEYLPREKAEDKYGMEIYQGGFIPGRELRIVTIKGLDSEACGGTHANNTKELEHITILNATKVQDGVIRINYVTGNAAKNVSGQKSGSLAEAATLLNVDKKQVPARAQEVFSLWKKGRKTAKKKKAFTETLIGTVEVKPLHVSDAELLQETARILSTQPEHVPKTLKRFLEETKKFRKN